MTTIDTLTERNSDFAAHRFVAGLPLMPTLRTMIIGCVDPRVDPAHVLGLDLGQAVVIRNIGGRITPTTLQTMAMLQTIAQVQGVNPTVGFNLIVLHHTDCGITRLEDNPDTLAGYFKIGKEELQACYSNAVTGGRSFMRGKTRGCSWRRKRSRRSLKTSASSRNGKWRLSGITTTSAHGTLPNRSA